MFVMIFLCFVSFTLGQEYKESYDKGLTKYGSYTIEKCEGLLCSIDIGVKTEIVKHELLKVDSSLIDSYAYGKSYLYQDDYKLFNDIEFYTLKGLTSEVKEYNIYILTKELKKQKVEDVIKTCNKDILLINGSLMKDCSYSSKIIDKEYIIEYYKEYNGELLKAGVYDWKVYAKRPINKPIDFILIDGVKDIKLSKWAWWDAQFSKKRKIDITYGYNQPSYNYSFYFNLTYDNDMNIDFSDVRFTDATETIELNYWIENKVNSSHALIYVKLPVISSDTSIYVYYKNNIATTTSNFNTAFIYADDFETNTSAKYSFSAGCTGHKISNGILNASVGSASPCHITPILEYQFNKGNYSIDFSSAGAGGSGYIGAYGHGADIPQINANNYIGFYWGQAGTDAYIVKTSQTSVVTQNIPAGQNAYRNISVILRPNNQTVMNISVTKNEILKATDSTTTNSGYYGLLHYNGIVTTDWFRVRSYIPVTPTYVIGNEESSDNAPIVTLNFPTNNLFSNNSLISFNCSAIDDISVKNLSLTIPYPLVNYTVYNTTYPQNLSLEQSFNFNEGVYLWSCLAYDSGDIGGTTASRTFTIDYTAPSVNITYPLNNQEFLIKTDTANITFIGNATDNIGLSVCAYNRNMFPSTILNYVTCGQNYTYNMTTYGNNDNQVRFFANDTTGNFNYSSYVRVFINRVNDSLTATNKLISETSQTIYLYLNATNSTTTTANLTYNNTIYPMTLLSNNNINAVYSVSFNSPLVTLSSNKTLYANYTINGNKEGTNLYYQIVEPYPNLTVSATPCSNLAINYTLKDSDNQSIIEGGIFEYNFNFYFNDVTNFTIYGKISNSSTLYICINSSISNDYKLNYGEVNYYDLTGNYKQRRNYLYKNSSLSNVTQNKILYTSTSLQSYSMKVQDVALKPYSNYYLNLLRWYPNLNSYQLVEMARTDNKGETILKVKLEDVDYRLGVYDEYGSLIELKNPIRFFCTVAPCTYEVTITSEQDFTEILNVQTSLTFNKTTNIFTLIYNDPSGKTDLVNLTVYKITSLDKIPICSSSAVSNLVVLTCNVTGYTGTLKAEVFRTASPDQPIKTLFIEIAEGIGSLDDSIKLFFGFILLALLSLIGAFAGPVASIIFICIGAVLLIYLGVLNWYVTGGIIVIGLVIYMIIKKVT